ncbi:hypothetical protein VPEG_00097 [Vibrio phage SIO-2]|uniref:hypothetical protein n=1 Tax=Vibrio phage SIO-2 TaxID=700512 RepID=UPI0002357C86|nr:hypothetical protein VPEG_00097 [Vibrio phage SIO-2]AET42247.1 hypothetical protein VPEG_00097 [Vibrio phage SIO-2]QKE60706.1 hypothetical protein vBVhaSVHB1_19 [Vibrio phage vB_VhaS-VHB1]
MILKLNELSLNPNMQIPELSNSFGVAMTKRATLSGGVSVVQAKVTKGRTLTLTASNNQGWITKDARDQLLTMSSLVGEVFTLTVANEVFSVVFDHSDGNAVNLTPFINRLIPLDGDYFTGTIRLLTV